MPDNVEPSQFLTNESDAPSHYFSLFVALLVVVLLGTSAYFYWQQTRTSADVVLAPDVDQEPEVVVETAAEALARERLPENAPDAIAEAQAQAIRLQEVQSQSDVALTVPDSIDEDTSEQPTQSLESVPPDAIAEAQAQAIRLQEVQSQSESE